ncbi:MAG: class I SAM-dependent methyltransferase, partial [Anaerolineaceae bacterium]|nr:class I SAM-dependent methyltransferase [Anaerolineaceae bacterium]
EPIEPRWMMNYKGLKFWAQTSASRHLGVFPEQACQWDWTARLIQDMNRPIRVLNLFGYTGLATLSAAQAGARVTHVDASKKAITWARDNQALSGLQDRPIRWIVDDALKFVEREARRGSQYEGLILDPPKFGRGPKGEVWEFYKLIPALLAECRKILSPQPLFVVMTAYAVKASSLTLYYALQEMVGDCKGLLTAGELVTQEQSAGRMISNAVYARWSSISIHG